MTLKDIKRELKVKAPVFAAKITPIYKALDWKWNTTGKKHFPSKDEIEKVLNKLINSLSKEATNYGSGGLEVFYEPPTPQSSGSYGLCFHYSDIEFFDYFT